MRIINGQRRFGCWAGQPNGRAEDATCCIEEVAEGGRSVLFHQCRRKRGHGPDGLYCKIHDPATIEAKRAQREEKYEAERRRWAAGSQRNIVSEIARKVFRQEASMDELKSAVAELERLLA